jgi:hypothetical protein
MDPRYRMVLEVDIDGRTYVLPVKYMKEDGRADGEKTNYILREVRGEIVRKLELAKDSVKVKVRSNVPPIGIFVLAAAEGFSGEVDGFGNFKAGLGMGIAPGTEIMLGRFDSFLRMLAKVSLVYISGVPVPR